MFFFIPIFRNNCSHTHVSEHTRTSFVYKRSENSDKLEAYQVLHTYTTCKMCNKINEKITTTNNRFPEGDVNRSDLNRYKYLINSDKMVN